MLGILFITIFYVRHQQVVAYFDFLDQINFWRQAAEFRWVEKVSRSWPNEGNSKFVNTVSKLLDDFETSRLHDSSLSHANLSNQCLVDLIYMLSAVKRKELWVYEVFDSWGKPSSGVLRGDTFWPGSYDQCFNVSARGKVQIPFTSLTENASFSGQYCIAKFINISIPYSPVIVNADLKSGFQFGLCFPNSCSAAGLNSVIKFAIHSFNSSLLQSNLTFKGIHCKNRDYRLDSVAKWTVVILGLIGLLVLISSIWSMKERLVVKETDVSALVDPTESLSDESTLISDPMPLFPNKLIDFTFCPSISKLFKCFNIYTNLRRLFSLKVDPNDKEDLHALHGIRFLSLAWIILGHTYYMAFSVVGNVLDYINPYTHGILFQLVIQGPYAVDTFFFLSGTLLAYNFVSVADKDISAINKVKFWILFYACRIWRLTPTYGVILLFYAALFKYLGDGPFWAEDGLESKFCRNNWWANLLYINNFVDFKDPNHPDCMVTCLGWSWFLAVDMQLFIFSPIILYPLYMATYQRKFKIVSTVIIFCALLSGLLITSVLVSTRNLPPNLVPADLSATSRARDLEMNVYFKPYPHICCYVIGIMVGYICFYKDYYAAYLRFRRVTSIMLWFSSLIFIVLVIFGLFPQYRGVIYSPHLSAFYYSCSRLAFGLSLAWIILSCRFGHAGIVNTFLSSKFFVPLSRLTFCAYLIHPIIMFVYYFSRRNTIYYTDTTMIGLFIAYLFTTYFIALFVALFVESPFSAVRKLILGNRY